MRSANFIGLRVDAVTFEELFDKIDRWLQDKSSRSHHIACQNVNNAVLALGDPELARIYAQADIAGADGMPFVHWIRAFVRPACDRLYAPDIVVELCRRARTAGYTFYLYGGSPETVQGMKRHLEERFPYLRILGCHSPPFRPATAEEDAAICAEINALGPDIVCVGLGTPKQDFWIDGHRDKIRGAVLVACGATFDFFGGRVKMAPRIIQRAGFEWLYRLAGPDRRRLWRRYTINNGVFLWNFALQLGRIRVRPASSESDER
jgi:N-acetylglucosaminyldiphosphoundecaprenol N-acetyl-beta-D-mannosaminyltransferase